jgi:hypothetical protein
MKTIKIRVEGGVVQEVTIPKEYEDLIDYEVIDLDTEEDKPEPDKTYALTGGPGTRCIANGNTWKDSEVKDD